MPSGVPRPVEIETGELEETGSGRIEKLHDSLADAYHQMLLEVDKGAKWPNSPLTIASAKTIEVDDEDTFVVIVFSAILDADTIDEADGVVREMFDVVGTKMLRRIP